MAVMHLTVPAYHKKIEVLCNLVGDAAADAGFNARTIYACQLAVGEACENIINHGYQKEGAGELELTARTFPGRLILELCDSAPPFNPSIEPGSTEWEDEPPVGGLGLLIIHHVMDKINYQRREGRNCLELHKTEGK
jgi:anti-sigma regulatory factor (Ser/Thr protein kinase)